MLIRNEAPSDIDAIHAVVTQAFRDAPHSDHTEQWIVDALREAGQLSISLLADVGGDVVGHVALSPVTISDGSCDWYGLGPVSVLPEWQKLGIGTRLVEAALAELRERRAAGCVVLGEPSYYARFGFRAEPSLVLPEVPPEYFQMICFTAAKPVGTVAYHAAFAAPGG